MRLMDLHYLNTLLCLSKINFAPAKWFHLNVTLTQQNVLSLPISCDITF